MLDCVEITPVLVVIPCLNEFDHIDGIISSVISQISGSKSLIVIADGGSRDGTVEKALKAQEMYESVVYMHNPKRIQSAAINSAVKKYGGDFESWVRIDAHAEYPWDFISRLISEQRVTGADSVVVSMATMGTHARQKAIAVAQNSRIGNGGSAHRQGVNGKGQWVDHGHHALMRVDAFLDVGGYDEDFSHNEDAELDVRLAKSGRKIWLTKATSMTYFPRSTYKGLMKQYFGYGRGRARTLVKHGARLRIRQVAPALLLPLSVLSMASPFVPVLAAPFIIWALSVVALGVVTAWRAPDTRSLSGMISVIWAICIMHMSWSAGFFMMAVKSMLSKFVGGSSND